MQNLVSAKELAEVLGLPARESVWRLVKMRRIPVLRVGKRMMRFDIEEVRAALDQQSETERIET